MTIIEVSARDDGFHDLQSQSGRSSCWLDGYIEVPSHLESVAWENMGYCELQIEDGVLVGVTPVDPPPPDLEPLKADRIAKSKSDLAAYLESHPLLWTDGNYYSITEEKQRQLTSKLAVAQAKATLGVPYVLKWNTTEEVCVPWELSDLYSLAFAIDERVTALVSYQQTQEVAMRDATTLDELNTIEVDYDSVV